MNYIWNIRDLLRKGVSKTDIIDMLSEGYLLTRAILSELIDYIIEKEPDLVKRGK